MDLTQITAGLKKHFDGGQDRAAHRVVFWNDPDHEFTNDLASIVAELDNVEVVNLDEIGALEAKVHIERTNSKQRYLIYSPTPIPKIEEDWLLDIRLYSNPEFSADRPSMLIGELGLTTMALRDYIGTRLKFLNSQDRVGKLRSLVHPGDTASDLDLKMMAVEVKADLPEMFRILQSIFHAMADGSETEVDLDFEPEVFKNLTKRELAESFWARIHEFFGYTNESLTLRDLLVRLMISDVAIAMGDDLPSQLNHFVLPASGWDNTKIFLANWRDSGIKGTSYDALSNAVSEFAEIERALSRAELDSLLDVKTFLSVEKRIASLIRKRVQTTTDHINREEISSLIARRRSGHWISENLKSSSRVPRKALRKVYDALMSATEFYDLVNQYPDGFSYPDAETMYKAYETELYRFDQLYRHFCVAADLAQSEGWDILKDLRTELSKCYENRIVAETGLAWGHFVSPNHPQSLLQNWSIEGVPNEHQFYRRFVKPLLKKGARRKVFVLISDAFRYEAAQELMVELNGKNRFKAELSSQLGVLPSYTELGMASLLPHDELTYTQKGGVTVDGKSTVASKRGDILTSVNGIKVDADELIRMSREESRELVRDRDVIYLYHDRVDATGDDRGTEHLVFKAVEEAIDELHNIVRYIINELLGSQVLLTADHGFLFQEKYPDQTDKSKIEEQPEGAIKSKKRYIIGRNLGDNDGAWHGDMASTADASGDMEFWVPKNTNLFHFVGGSRFVHGGAMLQEITVPVLFVQQTRGKEKERLKVKHVEIIVLGSQHRITTNAHRFELLQTEPVTERNKAVTIKAAVYDGDQPVTNIETLAFDSTSGNMDDRKKWANFTLLTQEYDKAKEYCLVLRNADTEVELGRVTVTIDRAFTNDF